MREPPLLVTSEVYFGGMGGDEPKQPRWMAERVAVPSQGPPRRRSGFMLGFFPHLLMWAYCLWGGLASGAPDRRYIGYLAYPAAAVTLVWLLGVCLCLTSRVARPFGVALLAGTGLGAILLYLTLGILSTG